jgi:integrase
MDFGTFGKEVYIREGIEMAISETSDRKYLITIYTGGNPRTRSKRVDLTHMTKSKAAKEIVLIEQVFKCEVKGSPDNNSNIRFREFVKIFMDEYALIKPLRPRTMASYNEELEKRILPEFGSKKLNEIMPIHLVKFYSKLKKTEYMKGNKKVPLSTRTIYYQHQILSSIFTQAVKWKYLKENPCKAVSPERPKKTAAKKKRKERQWEVSEAIAFIQFIKNEPVKYICATLLALVGGLRTEEILGLDIKDIEEHGIIIRRTCKYVEGTGMLVEELAKNDSSERSVALPDSVIAYLRKLKTEQEVLKAKMGNLWQGKTETGRVRILLFTQYDGNPMHYKTFYHWLKKQIDKYNEGKKDSEKLKYTTPHGLRHTSAALLGYLGTDNRASASRMGHALTSTYLDMYGSEFDNADVEIANKLGDVLKLG